MTSDVLQRTAAGVVYGNLSLKVGESSFPHPDWTDFVVVVLTWWCHAVLQLLSEDRGLVEVRFMDGPFLVEIGIAELDTWHMSLVEAGLKRRVRDEAEVERGPLIHSVLDVATEQ